MRPAALAQPDVDVHREVVGRPCPPRPGGRCRWRCSRRSSARRPPSRTARPGAGRLAARRLPEVVDAARGRRPASWPPARRAPGRRNRPGLRAIVAVAAQDARLVLDLQGDDGALGAVVGSCRCRHSATKARRSASKVAGQCEESTQMGLPVGEITRWKRSGSVLTQAGA